MNGKKLYRTFIAIDFPDSVIKEIARVQEILQNLKFNGKMTELENLHLTLKFLGGVDDNKLEDVRNKLKEIEFQEIEVKLVNIGTFSFRGDPRIIWIKVGAKGIFELQKKIDKVLEEIGFKKEERFMSHTTIARIKYVKDKDKFREYIKNVKLKEIKFKIKDFKLKESELREMGPIYKDLEIYKLN